MERKLRNPRGEWLVDLDAEIQRGEKVVGPIDTDAGPKRLVMHWRRVKRLKNSETARLRRDVYGRTA